MRLVITFDPEAGCAYVSVGAPRRAAATRELDEDTSVDYDENGEVTGVEFIGVSTPELVILEPRPERVRRRFTDVTLKGELL